MILCTMWVVTIHLNITLDAMAPNTVNNSDVKFADVWFPFVNM